MKKATLADYQKVKSDVIYGVEYQENSTTVGNTIKKSYSTDKNGTFYEVDNGECIEFWSDKQPESRYYTENE